MLRLGGIIIKHKKSYKILYVDSHESRRHPTIKKLCKGWEWQMEIKQLKYGDYVYGNTVVEWKSITDFCSSILDGRLKREAINQANHYPHHFVFVVGNMDNGLREFNRFGKRRNFHYPQIWGAVASLCTFTNVIFCPNDRQAFYQMKFIMEKCNEEGRRNIIPVDKLSTNPCFNFLNGSYGVGTQVAENVCEQLKLTKLSDLLKVTQEDLLQVDLVGKGRARAILVAIHGEDEYEKVYGDK